MVHLSSNNSTLASYLNLLIYRAVTLFEFNNKPRLRTFTQHELRVGLEPTINDCSVSIITSFPLSLTTTYGISLDFSPSTKMFQFLGYNIDVSDLDIQLSSFLSADFRFNNVSGCNILVIRSLLVYTNQSYLSKVLKDLNFRLLWCKHNTLPTELNTHHILHIVGLEPTINDWKSFILPDKLYMH